MSIQLYPQGSGAVPPGQSIHYPTLAPGDIALTVRFEQGGGAGIHLTALAAAAPQWQPFLCLISGRRIVSAVLDGDLTAAPGWCVHYQPSHQPDLNQSPCAGSPPDKSSGWQHQSGLLLRWFSSLLGVEPMASGQSHPARYRC